MYLAGSSSVQDVGPSSGPDSLLQHPHHVSTTTSYIISTATTTTYIISTTTYIISTTTSYIISIAITTTILL